MEKGHDTHSHRPLVGRLRHLIKKGWYAPFLIGIASLLWFLIRTGSKPSRAAFPCQRAALANASSWLGTLALPALMPRPAALVRWEAGLAGLKQPRFVLFLVAAAALGAVGATPPGYLSKLSVVAPGQDVVLQLTTSQLPVSTFSDIYAVQGTNVADEGFERLLRLMERRGQSFYSLVNRSDVVIIKVNSQWDERGGTNTDLVKAVVQGILDHPEGFAGEIVIADNGQAQYGAAGRGGSLDWESNNAVSKAQSMQTVADSFSRRHKVSTASWDRFTTTRVGEYSEGDLRSGYVVESSPSPETGIIVSYPKFETAYGTLISFKKGIWNPGS